MQNEDRWGDIKLYTIVQLTHTSSLSDKLHSLLEKDIEDQRSNFELFEQHELLQLPNLMIEAANEGYITRADFRELEKKNPEKAKRIRQQSFLRIEHVRQRGDLELAEDLFPKLTWSSLVLICMAQFEEALTLICDFLTAKRHYPFKMRDLAGRSTMERSKKYLRRMVGLTYDFGSSKEWDKLAGHQTVRNLIIHNSGLLDGSSQAKRAESFVAKHETVLIVEDKRLVIVKEYIDEIVDDAQKWMEEIFNEIDSQDLTSSEGNN